MNRFFTYLLSFLISANVVAQVNVCGTVIDKEMNEPLAGASVIIKGADGKIKKFSTSKGDGGFAISVPSVAGCSLEVSMMTFEKKSISLDNVSFPLTIYLEPGSVVLKEVAVKADRIREQGDTITYSVGSFAQAQDRSIGDVLKRMPGIDVAKSGKIQYQGEDINKFYIEGSDLLGGKYGIATNGINHEDVGAVEVMENHQPMQVLSGISFSDKAAINLKLKNRAKATWSLHGDAAGGYSCQPEGAIWDGELFAMAVMSNFQNITTIKTNNIGENISAQATDFFSGGRGTGLSHYVSVSLPGVPGLNRKRTLFNRSALVSTNSLWKLGRGEFKMQLDYGYNRVSADASNITTYFLEDGNKIITENRSAIDRSNSLSGKFIYELNQKTAFINNTLKTNIDWDEIALDVTGSLPNNQFASLPDYYVSNNFKLIKRFNGKHLVTFESVNEWETLPQTLRSNRFLSSDIDNNSSRQTISDYGFYTQESAAYSFSLNGVTVGLEGGLKGYVRSMTSELDGTLGNLSIIDNLDNAINTNYLTFYVVPKFEYWIKRVDFSLNAPVSFTRYTFNSALANRSEGYFSPSLNISWKPNNRFSMSLRGRSGRSPMSLNMIHPGYIMTNYRSFRQGVDDFYTTTSQSVSLNLSYKHTRRGIFTNAMAMQSWSHVPYTMIQQLLGDYIVYSYSAARSSGKMFMSSGNLGKTLDFIRGSVNVNGSFSRNESNLISEKSLVNSVSTSWLVGGKINGAPIRWLSFDYKISFSNSRIAMNGIHASWLGSMENEMLINIMPHKKWEWHVSGEHYRNEITGNTFKNVCLFDTKLIFKPSKRVEVSAMLNNILNQRTYNYTSYSQLSSFESQRWLRGREFLVSISIKK